jgi:hypothetical protein
MGTELQNAANQRNALRSTGPRSLEGKRASSRNAVSHGLTARHPLLPGEKEEEFVGLRNAIFGKLQPDGALENQMVERVVSLIWRLKRIPNLEMALFQWVSYQEAALHDDQNALQNEAPRLDHNSGEEVHVDLADTLKLGRMIETALSRDLMGKFARHEVGLSKQLQNLLAELRAMKAARLVPEAPQGQKTPLRWDHVTADGKLKPP